MYFVIMKKVMKYFLFMLIILTPMLIYSEESDELCMECHGDKTLTTERNGKTISLFVNGKSFTISVHKEKGCIGCHSDIDPEDLPHDEILKKVDCAKCHKESVDKFNRSLHGAALKKGKYLAPDCQTCHGKHNILSSKNEKSQTYVMNIPNLCGNCHKEGTLVSQLKTVSQRHILENYSQSIHGDGLYRRGLTVTAVCISCHNSHDILPHEDPKSSINRYNIPKTCMKCHSQIEKVHTKVIDGKLWEKKPHELPVCVDCHQPHVIRRVFYEGSYPNSACMECHSNKNLFKTVNGKKVPLFVDENSVLHSAHAGTACIKCHTNISNNKNPVCIGSGKVDCSMCHSEQVNDYNMSWHGRMHAQGKQDAPYCTDCHGDHNILPKKDANSPTYVRNIPNLCGSCHREGEKATRLYKGKTHEVVNNYSMSIHGKGLVESGLIVTATCIDCHTSHKELPADDPASSVHKNNIAGTCGNCHMGIYDVFRTSIHSSEVNDTKKNLPVCNDCHFSHTIDRVSDDNFRNMIQNQCGKCHDDVTESYFETLHGKVSKLGSGKTAKCHDCHGAHNILPVSDPKSTLSHDNIVGTCQSCHPNSNRKFVGYLTHATHHNKEKYPFLFYTFWFMTILLVSTFAFFGIHTLLWIPRSYFEKKRLNHLHKSKSVATNDDNDDPVEDIPDEKENESENSNLSDNTNDTESNNPEEDDTKPK